MVLRIMLTYLTTSKYNKILFDQFHPEIHGVLGFGEKNPRKDKIDEYDESLTTNGY